MQNKRRYSSKLLLLQPRVNGSPQASIWLDGELIGTLDCFLDQCEPVPYVGLPDFSKSLSCNRHCATIGTLLTLFPASDMTRCMFEMATVLFARLASYVWHWACM